MSAVAAIWRAMVRAVASSVDGRTRRLDPLPVNGCPAVGRRRSGVRAGRRRLWLAGWFWPLFVVALFLIWAAGIGPPGSPLRRRASALPPGASVRAQSNPVPVFLPLTMRGVAELPRPTAVLPTATDSVTAQPTASPPGTPTAAVPAKPIFGVQVGVMPYGRSAAEFEAFLNELLDRLTEVGVAWLRVPVLWYAIEPLDASPPQRDWSFADLTLGTVSRRGLSVMAVVYGHPSWAASRSCGPIDRVPISRYGEFMAALVERYDGDGLDDAPGSPVVRYWEIGNEPDFAPSRAQGESDYGSCFGDAGGPAAYAEYLREASLAVHAADPGAQVVFGAVAYDRFYNLPGWYRAAHRGPFRYGFCREVLTQLGERYAGQAGWPFVDAFAVHNYNDFRDNWETNADDGTAVDRELMDKLRRFRTAELGYSGHQYDWESLPLVVSEVSMADAPANQWIERSAEYQSAYVGQVMVRAMASGAEAAIWFIDQDFAVGACDQPDAWQTFGLYRSLRVAREAARCPTNPLPEYEPAAELEAKPAATALQTVSRELAGAWFDRALSPTETGHWELQAYRFQRPAGGYVLVAFVDHGQPLGRKISGEPVPDRSHTLRVDGSILPDWSGRARVVDSLGHETRSDEDPLVVTVDYHPLYISALP